MYQLQSAQKLPSGFILHNVKTYPGSVSPERIRYYGLRFALVFPSAKSPAYFVGGGTEVFDEKMEPVSGEIIRVTVEYTGEGLGLDSFFDRLTDEMTAQLSETAYADLTKEDFKQTVYSYLDRRGLRNLTIQQAPYSDFVLRMAKVKDYDDRGNLILDKGSPLYNDLRAISRLDLEDEPEIRFYRLNALSMLVGGFSKYPARPPLAINVKRMMTPDWRL